MIAPRTSESVTLTTVRETSITFVDVMFTDGNSVGLLVAGVVALLVGVVH